LAYKSFTSTKWGSGLPNTLFDVKASDNSKASFSGALTLLQKNIEKHSGDLQQYTPAAKVVVGAGLSLAGPEVIISSARYMKYDNHEQMSLDSYKAYAVKDISSYKWYYGGLVTLFAAHNFESINNLANTCGKGFELGFEHVLGLSGDTPGLLDAEFYSK
jgi:hypothetical protein